jgi:hypothetical protein
MIFDRDEDFREHFIAGGNFTLSMVKPLFPKVEAYMVDILGRAQWEALIVVYNAAGRNLEAVADAKDKELIVVLREPFALLCILHYIPIGNLSMTAGGFTVTDGENKKAASQFRIQQFEQGVLQQAYDAMHRALLFLERKKAVYTDWAASDTYKELNTHFIANATDFSAQVNIHNNQYVFLKFLAVMNRVEEYRIRPLLGDVLFDSLITKRKAGTAMSAAEEKLILRIKTTVANLTMRDALPELGVRFDNRGITLFSNERNNDQPSLVAAADSHIQRLLSHYSKKGEASLSALETFLVEKHDDYPDWPYEEPEDETPWRFNENNGGFVGL